MGNVFKLHAGEGVPTRDELLQTGRVASVISEELRVAFEALDQQAAPVLLPRVAEEASETPGGYSQVANLAAQVVSQDVAIQMDSARTTDTPEANLVAAAYRAVEDAYHDIEAPSNA